MSLSPRDRLIVSLDFPSLDEALGLVEKMGETISYYKIGLELFSAAGPEAVRRVKGLGKSVFLDLKFHDIPNTVAGACRAAVRAGANMFNVHVSGGAAMMRAAAEATAAEAKVGKAAEMGIDLPVLLGVTVLTSLDREALENEVGIAVGESIAALVAGRAKQAKEAGLGGVVASPKEVERIREICGKDFHIVTPGVRPSWAATGDQKRIATPADAIKMGADRIVVGRPITQADDPLEAAVSILEEISQEESKKESKS